MATFHCPNGLCSSVSYIFDAAGDERGATVMLVCSLKHLYWVPVKDLVRVYPYWPSVQGLVDGDAENDAERPALA